MHLQVNCYSVLDLMRVNEHAIVGIEEYLATNHDLDCEECVLSAEIDDGVYVIKTVNFAFDQAIKTYEVPKNQISDFEYSVNEYVNAAIREDVADG